jgi:AmiR/NasT family two-component response regulator
MDSDDVVARLRDENTNLQRALESRDVIGQAKGILTSRRGISAEEAFALLVRHSQDHNRKLRDVAEDLVEEAARLAAEGGAADVVDIDTRRAQ